MALYDLTNDPFDAEKGRWREAHKRRDKEIDGMRVNRTSIYATSFQSSAKKAKMRSRDMQIGRILEIH